MAQSEVREIYTATSVPQIMISTASAFRIGCILNEKHALVHASEMQDFAVPRGELPHGSVSSSTREFKQYVFN